MAVTDDFAVIDIDSYTVGFDTARARIREIEAALANMHEPVDEIVKDIHRQTLAQFVSEGAALGDPWEPLEPGTVKDKAAGGALFAEWPLVDTGALMDSASSTTGPFSVSDILDHSATLELDFERDGWNIAALQQLGVEPRMVHRRAYVTHEGTHVRATSYEWHLPARPYWEATEALGEEGLEHIAVHIFQPLA